MSKENILASIQIVISIIIVGSVLIQQRGSGVGSLFGGQSMGGGEFYRARRGFEKFVFYLTIVMATLLVVSSFLYLYI
jgi:protein translocase SecG subunit